MSASKHVYEYEIHNAFSFRRPPLMARTTAACDGMPVTVSPPAGSAVANHFPRGFILPWRNAQLAPAQPRVGKTELQSQADAASYHKSHSELR
eukprot:scaffold102891_cov39-Prasinocladus_malaysianus.AAC.3